MIVKHLQNAREWSYTAPAAEIIAIDLQGPLASSGDIPNGLIIDMGNVDVVDRDVFDID